MEKINGKNIYINLRYEIKNTHYTYCITQLLHHQLNLTDS